MTSTTRLVAVIVLTWALSMASTLGIVYLFSNIFPTSNMRGRQRLAEFSAPDETRLWNETKIRTLDYMKDITKLSEDADYQEILTYAAQREKRTGDCYVALAKRFQGTQVGELFMRLADEELKHKIKIEKEFDDNLLRDN